MTPQVVLIGGGHAHALVLRAWAKRRHARARLVLVTPDRHTAYSGMVPGHLAGHYTWADCHIDLAPLAAAAGAKLVLDRCVGLDRAAGCARLAAGGPLAFDLLSLDIGSTSALPALAGVEHLCPVKPIAPFLNAWDALLTRAGPPPAVVVLGGGVGGIELVLAMAHRLGANAGARLTLVEQTQTIAGELTPTARARVEAALRRAGVAVRTNATVDEVTASSITLDGERIAADFVVAATGARAAPWLQETGLALDDAGFVRVGGDLRAEGEPRIFAVGDTAHLSQGPRPKAGVFAVRQGPVLHAALWAALDGRPLPTYAPQADYLRLIALGRKCALATKHGWTMGGDQCVGGVLWRLKDRIDRNFMRRLRA